MKRLIRDCLEGAGWALILFLPFAAGWVIGTVQAVRACAH